VTVLEAIKLSGDFLAKKGVDSPRLQAELLLADVLKLPRMRLYLDFGRELTETETKSLRELVRRRGTREPLQHILGTTNFCGLELKVTSAVLVPRPETELLAEEGWIFLQQVERSQPRDEALGARPDRCCLRALDLGTGSGCLAIILAAKCPKAEVWAVDVSKEALEVARQNAEKHEVASRINFVEGDFLSAVPSGTEFDLIISNPPYIPSRELAGLQPEVRDFDPGRGLDGGVDGLEFYRLLAMQAALFLRLGGKVMFEFGDGQEHALQRMFEEQKWIVEAFRVVFPRRPRLMVVRKG